MALPLLLGGLGRLGLSAVTSSLSGLGMGIGYGYGVRLGYNAYKPSKNANTNNLVKSLDPLSSGTGMGLHTAELQQDKKTPVGTMTQEPSIQAEASKTVESTPTTSKYNSRDYFFNKWGQQVLKSRVKTREQHKQFITSPRNDFFPGTHQYGKARTRSPKYRYHSS